MQKSFYATAGPKSVHSIEDNGSMRDPYEIISFDGGTYF